MSLVKELSTRTGMSEYKIRKFLNTYNVHGRVSNSKIEEIARVIKEFFSKPLVMVGADPEFEVRDEYNNYIPAHRVFNRSLKASLGTDGASQTGELRPAPGSPEFVFSKTQKLLSTAKNRLPEGWKIFGGAGREYPLGGHIHISGRPLSSILSTKLEEFVAQPLNQTSSQIIRGSYSTPKQFRPQGNGATPWWEYRTPCSWLAHPDLTRGALTIAWCLANQSDKVLERITTRGELYKIMGVRAEAAKKYYYIIDTTNKIETINVFKSWKLTKKIRKARTITTTNLIPVDVSYELRGVLRGLKFPVRVVIGLGSTYIHPLPNDTISYPEHFSVTQTEFPSVTRVVKLVPGTSPDPRILMNINLVWSARRQQNKTLRKAIKQAIRHIVEQNLTLLENRNNV